MERRLAETGQNSGYRDDRIASPSKVTLPAGSMTMWIDSPESLRLLKCLIILLRGGEERCEHRNEPFPENDFFQFPGSHEFHKHLLSL